MEIYKSKQKVLAWKWEGDISIIDEINEAVKIYNDDYLKVKVYVSTDKNVLVASIERDDEYHGIQTSNDFVREGDYIVLDWNNQIRPLGCYSETHLNNTYDLC